MNEKTYFRLTKKQKEVLAPLIQQVDDAQAEGKRGIILGQLLDESFYGMFIPHKYAIKMNKIMREMEGENQNQT